MTNLPITTPMQSRTPTLALSLPAKLQELVMGQDSPIVGPNTAQQLLAFADEPEPPLASREQVEVMIGKLALATAQAKATEAEANERLDLYWLALNDIPVSDLRLAFAELLKTATFLPTPAEVRKAALKPGAARRYAKSRARHLAWKHQMEWKAPVAEIPQAEVRALLAGVQIAAQA